MRRPVAISLRVNVVGIVVALIYLSNHCLLAYADGALETNRSNTG